MGDHRPVRQVVDVAYDTRQGPHLHWKTTSGEGPLPVDAGSRLDQTTTPPHLVLHARRSPDGGIRR